MGWFPKKCSFEMKTAKSSTDHDFSKGLEPLQPPPSCLVLMESQYELMLVDANNLLVKLREENDSKDSEAAQKDDR